MRLSHDVEFFTKLADPNFAENFNIGGDQKGLYFVARGSGGSLFGRDVERTFEIMTGARLIAKMTGKPDAFKGLKPAQVTQISKNLKTLQNRMLRNISTLDAKGMTCHRKGIVAKDMNTAIQNADNANSYSAMIKSVLPTTSLTMLACGAAVLYTAAALKGYFPPVLF